MPIDERRLWRQIRLGEDSELEFQEMRFEKVEVKGSRVSAPKRPTVADELAAFANSTGGRLVLGVTDQRETQPLTPDELDRAADFVTELCQDSIKPPLDFSLHRVSIPGQEGRGVLVVEVPAGKAVHRSPGGVFRRRGSSKRLLEPDEIGRLVQSRGRSDAASTDTQVVANTTVGSLDPKLWGRYASSRVGDSDEVALSKLKFVKDDGAGVLRATVGGVLLASQDPREWLPNAFIQAVCYGGDRPDGNRQLDAMDIAGPLDQQIRDAVRFVLRNRRVAARKEPARRDVPQYSERAVFEAVVNAVVHRDYAVRGSKIRLFMFDDRLEICSPGGLGNSMTVDDLRTSQFTRNEMLASRLGQCPVGEVAGAGGRQYFIERRGEGVGVIEDQTFALAGRKPLFEALGERELKLVLPAASPPVPEGVAVRVAVVHDETGKPLRDMHVLVVYPNKTYLEARTDAFGHADFKLYAKLPMTVFCAAPGFAAGVASGFEPGDGPGAVLELRTRSAPEGGSVVIPNGTGYVPGIRGRLNPIRDDLDRLYVYADNVAVNDGVQQPAYFRLNEPIKLTDALGSTVTVWFREVIGSSTVFDYAAEIAPNR